MLKKRILKNIPKIWHLLKGDLSNKIIIWQQGAELDLGIQYQIIHILVHGKPLENGDKTHKKIIILILVNSVSS
jgi:hypothetical protein